MGFAGGTLAPGKVSKTHRGLGVGGGVIMGERES